MTYLALALGSLLGLSSPAASRHVDGPYHIVQTAKVGGEGGFDYVYADTADRKLFVCRTMRGAAGGSRVDVFNLDTMAPAGQIADVAGHGVAVDSKYHTAFATSNPVAMWDAQSGGTVKTIKTDGSPDGLLNDPFNHRIYILSHRAPNVTVLDAKDGAVLGTIDIGGMPEQAATDGHGHIYIDIEDKGAVAVIDANTMKMTNTFSLGDHGGGNAGLALDARNHVLFVACRDPQAMVMIDANDGHFLASLPIGRGCDGAVFNPQTMECFSSQGDGTLNVIKEDSPTTFSMEQTVKTPAGAKTCTLDEKTGNILLITAEYAPAPASADGSPRRGRGPMVAGSFQIVVVGK